MKSKMSISKPVLRKDLEIPNGFRLAKVWEIVREVYESNLNIQSGYYWVEIRGEICASWLDFFNNNSSFLAVNRYVNLHFALRGVFIKKVKQ